jgi:hypothetical protein
MAAFLNVCRFNPTAGGTTDWTFVSAVTGYQSPALAGVVNGRVYKYRAESADLSQWELGEGAYNTGTGVLARTTVLYNSSGTGTGAGQSGAGTKISFAAAPQVAITALKEDLISVDEANVFTAAQQAQAKANLAVPAAGQCVLAKVGADLVLSPRNGNLLTINGSQFAVPDAGVSMAATGLTVATLYYIYAFMSGATATLEASTTAYAVSTTVGNKGVVTKSGDQTRTLVGMARVITGPAWQDTAAQRFVRSWFNDNGVENLGTVFATRGVTSSVAPTYVELQSGNRIEMLLWAGERWVLEASGSALNNTSPAACYTAIGVDGTTPEEGRTYSNSVSSGSIPFYAKALKTSLTEGYHYGTLLGAVSSSTGQWSMTSDGGGCVMSGFSRRN